MLRCLEHEALKAEEEVDPRLPGIEQLRVNVGDLASTHGHSRTW